MSTYKKICQKVSSIAPSVRVSEERGCIVLRGELNNWADIVACGKAAVSKKYLGVINDIKLKGFLDSEHMPSVKDDAYEGATPDVLVIGAGISGASVARELSRWKLNVMLVEKGYDVALQASSRNDGCVHVGIDLHKGQEKLKYNGLGNKMYADLCADLAVPFKRDGHLILMYAPWEKRVILKIWKLVAKRNGIEGVRFMPLDELKQHNPNVPDWAIGAYYMPSGGIVSPYKLVVAYAENAAENGVKVCLNTAVTGMKVEDGTITAVETNRGIVYPRLVVNAAGVFSDKIADMAGDRTFTIHPRKGINLIMDKKIHTLAYGSTAKMPFVDVNKNYKIEKPAGLLKSLMQYKATSTSVTHTKGGGVVETADHNVLVGPNALETPYREDVSTDSESIKRIFEKQTIIADKMKMGDIITYFAGVRAPTYEEDFVVRKGIFTKNIIEVAGIQSPGLTAAPAIAIDVAKWAVEMLGGEGVVKINKSFNPVRQCAVPHLADMTEAERNELISKNPDYGEIVCRCEEVSKGEIIDAINSPVPVYNVDAIKRRVRPGMGRCQGGFCGPLVLKILAEQKGCSVEDIQKAGDGSTILFDKTKGGITL